MDKYRKVQKSKESLVKADNEIRVTAVGSVSAYVSFAAKVFNEMEKSEVVIKATGNALAKAVTVSEIIKRRFKGLHQITDISATEIVDEYEPIEEGLDRVIDTRSVACAEITLSKEPLDTANKGYQPPVDESLVTTVDPDQLIRSRGRGQGRGRKGGSGKGKGKRGKGKKSGGEEDEEEEEEQKKEEAPRPRQKGKGKKKASKAEEEEEEDQEAGKSKGSKGGKGGKGKGKLATKEPAEQSGKGKSKAQGKGKSYQASYNYWDDWGSGNYGGAATGGRSQRKGGKDDSYANWGWDDWSYDNYWSQDDYGSGKSSARPKGSKGKGSSKAKGGGKGGTSQRKGKGKAKDTWA